VTGIFDARSGAEIFAVALSTFDDKMQELRGLFKSVVTPNGVSLPTTIAPFRQEAVGLATPGTSMG